ncbi:MAG: hypothetical protein AAGJ54_13515 [Planctomycetota bacterium]
MNRYLSHLAILNCALLTGCVYNDAPIHLYMQRHEMDRTLDEHFDLAMPAEVVGERLDQFGIAHRTLHDGTIEAVIWKAGPRLSFSCCPGTLEFRFDDGELYLIMLRHPLPDDSGVLASPEPFAVRPPLWLPPTEGVQTP